MTNLTDRLRELSESGERGEPLVFAGREGIIQMVERKMRQLPPNGAAGNTVLIEGAPGVGKTALLGEISRRLEQRGIVSVLHPEVPSESNIESIYARLAAALTKASEDAGRTTTQTSRSASLRFAGMEGRRLRSTTVASAPVGDPQDIADLRRGRAWTDKDKAAVLLDEVQNLESGDAAGRFVRTLHTQRSVPLLLVCAGLSNSEKRLAAIGLSRIGSANVVALGPLSAGESLQCAQQTFRLLREAGLRCSDEEIESWSERMAGASDGWPRHLQNYFRAGWLALAEQESPALGDADLDEVMGVGDSFRDAYYRARLRLANLPVEVVAALHRSMAAGDRLDEYQAIGEIGAAVDALADPHVRRSVRDRFPTNDGCFEQMLKVGVLSLDAEGVCVSPVPSFTRYVLASARAATR